MTTLLEEKLWHFPSMIVTESQLAQLLGGTNDSYSARINRAVVKKQLIRLKRGLFCLGKKLAAKQPSAFEISQFIYGPSYISLESALSYHGLIPEAVYATTSACVHRNKTFTNDFGNFYYERLPTENFFIEVTLVQENATQYFVSTPWKALLDYVYCRRLDWRDFSPVFDSLRIDPDELPTISANRLENLKQYYSTKRIVMFIDSIPKEFIK